MFTDKTTPVRLEAQRLRVLANELSELARELEAQPIRDHIAEHPADLQVLRHLRKDLFVTRNRLRTFLRGL